MDTFDYIMRWLERERFEYQPGKFDYSEGGEDRQKIQEFNDREHPYDKMYWTAQLENYLYRAYVLGFDTPAGRQALAKHAATAVAMVEAMVEVYGELPEPGVTSGENLDKLMPKS